MRGFEKYLSELVGYGNLESSCSRQAWRALDAMTLFHGMDRAALLW